MAKTLRPFVRATPPCRFEALGGCRYPPRRSRPSTAHGPSEELDVANMNFKVVYVATARYLAEFGTWKPVIASLMGLFITGAVVGYFWLLTGRMASVERRVADRWLELRERERYIRHLVDNTGDAIFLCDEQGTILDINQRACESLGYSREKLLSMTMADVELPVDAENAEPLAGRPAEGYPETFERVYLRNDGTTFPVEVHMTSVGIGRSGCCWPSCETSRIANWRKRPGRKGNNVPPTWSSCRRAWRSSWPTHWTTFRRPSGGSQSDPETAQKTFAEGVRLLREVIGAAQ